VRARAQALLPDAEDIDAIKIEKKRYRLRVGNCIKKFVEECRDDESSQVCVVRCAYVCRVATRVCRR
jgi:hypothetical protein